MRIEIKVIAGPAKGRHFSFDRPDRFLFGRVADAHISLPRDPYVSRQHFLLEISPPDCKVTDLGSKNGTVVNGVRYGGRNAPEPGMKQAPNGMQGVLLEDGDEIWVGSTRMRIAIQRAKQSITKISEATLVSNTVKSQEISASMDVLDKLLSETATLTESVTNGAPSLEEYRIQGIIARGGMGIIYKAVEMKTGRTVAIKTMLPQVAIDPDNVQTFQREIDVTRQLRHPHIVWLFEHGKTQGMFYFILEFVDGMNLGQLINSKGHLSLEVAAPIILGTLDGLAYAHQTTITTDIAGGKTSAYNGVVHRDLKPANILLTRKGDVWFPKISDFGLAKSFESAGFTNLTIPGEVLGTPMYWAREQITHYKYLNPATDVFSAAAVFYEALTGKWVREGFEALFAECKQHKRFPTIPDYMLVITRNPVIPIRKRNPAIPEPVAKIIDHALQETEIPHDEAKMRSMLAELRYADAGAFRDALLDAFSEIGSSRSFAVPEIIEQPESQIQSWEPVPQDMNTREPFLSGAILYPTARTMSSGKEIALFVLDLVQSTQVIVDYGDTYYSTMVGNMHTMARKHASASEMMFMKSTGDGFLAAFNTMSAAFSLASTFLERHAYQDIHIRMALHWGTVKIGPDGDVLGKEVHRVSRIEGVKIEDRVDPKGNGTPLPRFERILTTVPGLNQLEALERKKFLPAGEFRLKGFNEPCELWVFTRQ